MSSFGIYRCNENGENLQKISSQGGRYITGDNQGSLYTTYSNDGRVYKHTTAGQLVYSFGEQTAGVPTFEPYGIAVTTQNKLVIADTATKKIYIFDQFPDISNFTATHNNKNVTLTWTDPTNSISGMIRRSTNNVSISTKNGTLVVQTTTGTTARDNNLNDGTYYYSFFPLLAPGEYGDAITITKTITTPIQPTIDTTGPGPIQFRIDPFYTKFPDLNPGDTKINTTRQLEALSEPVENDYAGVILRAYTPATPVTSTTGILIGTYTKALVSGLFKKV